MYSEAAKKGRQALLRFRANLIANYEAIYPIHFPPIERDPKLIYYTGEAMNFDSWYKDRKNGDAIYKFFEAKSTFTKFVFEDKDYDKVSIWKYIDYDSINKEISIIESKKEDINNSMENLIIILNDQKSYDNIEVIDKKISDIKSTGKGINDSMESLINDYNSEHIDKEISSIKSKRKYKNLIINELIN